MLLSFTIIAPIFGLILIGFCAGRFSILSPATGQGVADFTFILAIPALLFRTIVLADFSQSDIPAVWGAFFLSAGICWIAATLLATTLLKRTTRDAPSIAMSSVFGNTVMLGLPLAVATFGKEAAAPTIALVLALHAPTLWLTATLHQTFAETDETGKHGHIAPRALAAELLHNPIIIGILLGLAWRLSGLPLVGPFREIIDLLAQASIPCALIALGLSLTNFQITGQGPTLSLICAIKLILMPIVAFILATSVFQLPTIPAAIVTILAAMPTGANAYLFAVRHDAAPNSASGAVALTTLLAALTSSVVLAALSVGN